MHLLWDYPPRSVKILVVLPTESGAARWLEPGAGCRLTETVFALQFIDRGTDSMYYTCNNYIRHTCQTLALCMGLAPFGWGSTDPAESVLWISGSSWVHDAPTRVADVRGYFDGPGAKVKVSYEASGRASIDMLLARKVDYALVATTPLAQALLHQTPDKSPDDLVVLAAISMSNQTHHVLAVSERGIQRPSDLAYRRVGVLADTSAEYFWGLFAAVYGLAGVELLYMPLDAMNAALLQGEVDAVVVWDPWIYRIERDLGLETRRFSQRHIYTLNWLLVSHRATVEKYPDVADRILVGYLRAVKTMFEDPGLARQLQKTDADLSDTYLRSLAGKVIYHPGLQWSVLIDIEQQLDWFLSRQNGASRFRPGPERYLAPGPMSRVAPQRLLILDIWAGRDTDTESEP